VDDFLLKRGVGVVGNMFVIFGGGGLFEKPFGCILSGHFFPLGHRLVKVADEHLLHVLGDLSFGFDFLEEAVPLSDEGLVGDGGNETLNGLNN